MNPLPEGIHVNSKGNEGSDGAAFDREVLDDRFYTKCPAMMDVGKQAGGIGVIPR